MSSKGAQELHEHHDYPEVGLELELLPLNVKYFLLEIADCTSLLKTLRLVSRSWNAVSCRILRRLSSVPLSEDDKESLESFKDLLLDRQISFPFDWPNPFQNYKVQEATLTTPVFLRFVQRPGFRITTLDIFHRNIDFNLEVFQSILERQRESIIHLKITGKCENSPFLQLSQKLGTGWRSLKSITLKDSCRVLRPCHHMQFIIDLTANCSLREMKLEGHLPNTVSIFDQNKTCWDSLTLLHLQSDKPPSATAVEVGGFMTWAQEISFPSLTRLTVWFAGDESATRTAEEYAPHILPLIQESAQVLELLNVTFLPLSLLPSCPELKNLCCTLLSGDGIQDVSELRFPSLSSIHLCIRWREVPSCFKATINSHRLVTYATVYWDGNPSPGAIDTIWPSLRDHFPNLKKIWIQPNISFLTLTLIKRMLPKLQDINIRGSSADQIFGSNLNCSEAVAKGWAYEDIGGSPLLEMPELTHLRLGPNVTASKEIMYCMGCLPKLKFLKFHWNPSLKAQEDTEPLGHIEQVVIVYKGREQKRELEKVSKLMSCIKLEKL